MSRAARVVLPLVLALVTSSATASADSGGLSDGIVPSMTEARSSDIGTLRSNLFEAAAMEAAIQPSPFARSEAERGSGQQESAAQRPAPFVYSDGYRTRAHIHKIASVTIIPLFVTQGLIGASLYHDATPAKDTAHRVVATAIVGVFGLNTVTGVWNLIEGRRDPESRARRMLHGVLMLAADAGFTATVLSRPDEAGRHTRATHRAIALASISAASVGYSIMIFGY